MPPTALTIQCLRLVLAFALVVAVACGRRSDGRPGMATPPGPLTGTVTIDGSSTLMPLSRALAENLRRSHSLVTVELGESGTGGGFRRLCANGAELVGASRPISIAEMWQCAANGVAFVELPIAFDSLSVVVNAHNSFAACLSVAELKRIWEPAAEGRVTRWNQVRASFPDQPLTLAGPGTASGTFDYFTLAVVGTQSQSRTDYLRSEDDDVVAKTVASDVNAMGYFGYDYYVAHRDTLTPVAVDSGHGCVLPSPATVADHSYQPLSRPLFVYASTSALDKPVVKAMARSYLDPANAPQVRALGFVPLPVASLLTTAHRLEAGETGSRFGGRGSVLGLTLDSFQDEERMKNALVR